MSELITPEQAIKTLNNMSRAIIMDYPYTEELNQIDNIINLIKELTYRAKLFERLNRINVGIIDEYQKNIIPGFRERAEQAEQDRELLQVTIAENKSVINRQEETISKQREQLADLRLCLSRCGVGYKA